MSHLTRIIKKSLSHQKSIALFATAATVFTIFLTTHNAHAFALFGIGSIGANVVVFILFVATWIVSLVLGLIIGLEAWIISIILNFSLDIINSPVVQVGFPITLSIANLGFVIGLIILALGTIIRTNSYNAKQMLFKLVLAAIMVNFSLVIVGSLLRVSDIFTSFFINQINPATATGEKNGFLNFASDMAGAFSPQKEFVAEYTKNDDTNSAITNKGANFASSVGAMATAYSGMILSAITLVGIVISLGIVGAMIMLRYVSLLMLIVMMPMAWLTSIFPKFQSQWEKWWQKFINQLLFTPVAVFFLYLAIITSKSLSTSIPTNSTIPNSFAGALGNEVSKNMAQVLSMLTISGIMVGGLFAASSLGSEVAKSGLTTIKNASNKITGTLLTKPARSVGGSIGRGVERGGRGLAIKAGSSGIGKATAARLQKIGAGFDTSKDTGLKRFAKKTGNFLSTPLRKGATIAGSSIETSTKAAAEAQKKSYAETAAKRSVNNLVNKANSQNLSGTEFVETIKALKAAGRLSEVKNLEEQLARNAAAFEKLGEKPLWQQLGSFQYKDVLGTDGKPSGKKELTGDRASLTDGKIAEAKKEYKDLSNVQKAALLNDPDNLKNLNRDQIIALVEDLQKDNEDVRIAKNAAAIIDNVNGERGADKKIITDSDSKAKIEQFKYTDKNGVEKENGTYFDATGRVKTIAALKNSTGIAILEPEQIREQKLEEAKKIQDAAEKEAEIKKIHEDYAESNEKAIKQIYTQDPKVLAALITQNIANLKDSSNATDEEKHKSSVILGNVYNNIESELYGERMTGLLKALNNIPNGIKDLEDSMAKTNADNSSYLTQHLKRNDGSNLQVTVKLNNSVIQQQETKPHLYNQLLGFKGKDIGTLFTGNAILPKQQNNQNQTQNSQPKPRAFPGL